MPPSADSSLLHHRRPPAHLSVSLRHEKPAVSSADSGQALVGKKLEKLRPGIPAVKRARELSDSGNDSGNSSGAENWFDQSNSRPAVSINQNFVDGEPPYFLRQQESSNSLNSVSELNQNVYPIRPRVETVSAAAHAATNGSSADEYRSVIDDLTIENQRLKERLRRYEGSYSTPHLEKDRLFEVKVHGLPAKKKRELEETLQNFAASINGSENTLNMKVTSRNRRQHHSGHTSGHDSIHNPSSSSTSNSRLVDSAYASMSNSGPTSTFASDREEKFYSQPKYEKEQKVQSFLHNIPQGLLPRHSTVMTKKQKKNVVVRRLEQLFTGKTGSAGGDHSQPLQQQEVSNSATRADRAVDGLSSVEGLREAHMLPYEMEVDAKPEKLSDVSSNETQVSRSLSDLTPEDSQDDSSPDQRPTRPLDLDPDRAQIPSDNVDYIRHLGLSAPQFTKMESADAAADADGWIFLNLLVNMAQLHIINVTSDFVRSAVADVSDKFQLSEDGKQVRWRGGTEGTQLSSDSGSSSTRNQYPHESDSQDEFNKKRRKIDTGRFASVPLNKQDHIIPGGASQPNSFHYKPLFQHRNSTSDESTSYDESESFHEQGAGYGTGSKFYQRPRYSSQDSRSSSRGRRGEDGAIVFYSGAQFCIDLSKDRGNINTPVHVTGVGKDGYSNHTLDALGSKAGKHSNPLCRTTSGSKIPFRPFKDYSRVPDFLQTEETRPKTPELVTRDSYDLEFSPGWARGGVSEETAPLEFCASGLGGTTPADHFITKVGTERTILDGRTRAKLSKFSAPGPRSRRFLHRIPGSFLDSFESSEVKNSSDIITSGLASLQACRSPSPQQRVEVELPVKIRLLYIESTQLDPSPLPAPSAYYAATSSTEYDSDASSYSSGISHLREDHPLRRSSTSISDPKPMSPQSIKEDDEMQVDEDSDIDMLAHARKVDPKTVAAKEYEFERTREVSSLPSVAGESGYIYSESESDDREESDEDDDGHESE